MARVRGLALRCGTPRGPCAVAGRAQHERGDERRAHAPGIMRAPEPRSCSARRPGPLPALRRSPGVLPWAPRGHGLARTTSICRCNHPGVRGNEIAKHSLKINPLILLYFRDIKFTNISERASPTSTANDVRTRRYHAPGAARAGRRRSGLGVSAWVLATGTRKFCRDRPAGPRARRSSTRRRK